MGKIKIEVSPKDTTEIGWFVQLFSWSANSRKLVSHQLSLISSATGKYIFNSGNLNSGEYGLRLAVFESGRDVSAEALDTEVVYPRNKVWPLKVVVPTQATQYSDTWFFQFGDES